MSLYTVKFTTQRKITRYGPKREILSETETNTPVTITGLPRSTAESYSTCDNFSMEAEFASNDRPIAHRPGKSVYATGDGTLTRHGTIPRPTTGKKKRRPTAAETGDLGAALNA